MRKIQFSLPYEEEIQNCQENTNISPKTKFKNRKTQNKGKTKKQTKI
jgi:hypothetical protein